MRSARSSSENTGSTAVASSPPSRGVLHPDHRGVGLGTELAEALVAYGFGTLGLTEVHATVAAGNTASRTLLERIGFRHVRDIVEAGTAASPVV